MPAVRGPTLAMGGIWRLNSAPATIRSTRSTIARSNPSSTTSSMDRRPSTSRNRMRSMVAYEKPTSVSSVWPGHRSAEGALRMTASGTPTATDSCRTCDLYRSAMGANAQALSPNSVV